MNLASLKRQPVRTGERSELSDACRENDSCERCTTGNTDARDAGETSSADRAVLDLIGSRIQLDQVSSQSAAILKQGGARRVQREVPDRDVAIERHGVRRTRCRDVGIVGCARWRYVIR